MLRSQSKFNAAPDGTNCQDASRSIGKIGTPSGPGLPRGLGAGTLVFNNVSGVGRRGTGTLKVDGQDVATETMAHTLPLTKPLDTVFNIGDAAGTPLDDADYRIPFPFDGTIDKLQIVLEPPKLSPEDIAKLKEAEAKQAADQ